MMILIFFWLTHVATTLSSSLTLTTDRTITIYNGTTNPDFTLKDDTYDSSAYLYSYAQTTMKYQANTATNLGINNLGSPNVSISTYYGHFAPSVGRLTCSGQSCTVPIYHNCPSNLNSNNYFDIIKLKVQNIGSFYYYLDCNQ